MPKPNTPYDPQPERQDALGEIAREGYQTVQGNHSEQLSSLQNRLGLPGEKAPGAETIVRRLRPRRWLAVAAGIAALVVAGIAYFNYDDANEQFAKVKGSEAPVLEEEKSEYAADELIVGQEEVVTTTSVESLGQASESVANPTDFAAVKTGDLDAPAQKPEEGEPTLHDTPQKNNSKEILASAPEPMKKTSNASPVENGVSMITESEMAETADAVSEDDLEAEIANAPAADLEEAQASRFRMERTVPVKTREISGEVVEPSGNPIIGAILTIEETGQQVISDQKGEFTILLTEDAVVGNVSAEGYSELIFDVTAGEEYRLFLPRISSSIPSAQLKGKSVGLRLIAPKAEVYTVFDDYVAQQQSLFSGEEVTIQFDVNRFGRPRNIVSGPGLQNRDAIKKLKEWLKNGPDWPERYQRKAWRYKVVMP